MADLVECECPRCEGSGEIYDAYWTCGDPDCCGSGRGECPDCGGTGKIATDPQEGGRG